MRFLIILCISMLLIACSGSSQDASNNVNNTGNGNPTYPTSQEFIADINSSLLSVSGAYDVLSSVSVQGFNIDLTFTSLSLCDGTFLSAVTPGPGENIYGCVDNASVSAVQQGDIFLVTIDIPWIEVGFDVNGEAIVELSVENLQFQAEIPIVDNGDGTFDIDNTRNVNLISFTWGNVSMDYDSSNVTLSALLASTALVIGVLDNYIQPYIEDIALPVLEEILLDYTTIEL